MASRDGDRRSRRRGTTLLAARFADVGLARLAIAGLQSSGIDGDDIRWLSPFPEEPPPPNRTPDRRITRFLVRRVLVGALVGAGVGGFVGGLAGGVLVAVTSPAAALGEVVALAAVGMVIGTQVGAYVGFERAGTLSDAWSTTFDELESGAIWIGVRTGGRHDLARARRALERERPIELREL